MLIHFLNNYHVIGRVGDKIRIKGEFPGISEEDFVYLNSTDSCCEEEQTYKIEQIEYREKNSFNAVIAAA